MTYMGLQIQSMPRFYIGPARVAAVQIYDVFMATEHIQAFLAVEGGNIPVTDEWITEHNPLPGEFYVQREDRSAFTVPAKLFEQLFRSE